MRISLLVQYGVTLRNSRNRHQNRQREPIFHVGRRFERRIEVLGQQHGADAKHESAQQADRQHSRFVRADRARHKACWLNHVDVGDPLVLQRIIDPALLRLFAIRHVVCFAQRDFLFEFRDLRLVFIEHVEHVREVATIAR